MRLLLILLMDPESFPPYLELQKKIHAGRKKKAKRCTLYFPKGEIEDDLWFELGLSSQQFHWFH